MPVSRTESRFLRVAMLNGKLWSAFFHNPERQHPNYLGAKVRETNEERLYDEGADLRSWMQNLIPVRISLSTWIS